MIKEFALPRVVIEEYLNQNLSGRLECIIIDSINPSLNILHSYLQSAASIAVSEKISSIQAAEAYCVNHRVDMVICNIDIVNAQNIQTIKYLQPECLIVCAGERDAIEQKGFEENIFAYLYKPFSYERIMALTARANIVKGNIKPDNNQHKKSYVFIKSEYKTIRVDLEDILYCEGLKDYTQIHLKGRAKPLVTLQNLKSLAEKLPTGDFIRVHRSFIVRLDKIDAISRNEIAIGSTEIPIGDAYKDRLNCMIGSHS